MSTKINYNNIQIADFSNTTKTLPCSGKVMTSDIVVTDTGGGATQSKTLTLGANAPSTVNPDSGKVLSSVPVVLDTSVIKAENIKKGVTILGVIGTYEGGVTPTGETWVINELVDGVRGELNVNISFQSNGSTYSLFLLSEYVEIYYDALRVYMDAVPPGMPKWMTTAYRTITLDEPATGDFLTWLEANAVKQ